MYRIAGCTLLALFFVVCLTGPSGCGGTPVAGVSIPIPEKWVDEVISWVVSLLEDETGIDIEKGDVKIESLGARKDNAKGGHISDFKITVTYRKTEFSSTPKDIPCSADGIPTEEGNTRVKQSIDEIKYRIREAR